MRLRIYIFFLIGCFSITLSLQAQTTISGIVKNKKGEPLIANVIVQAKESTTISGFAITSEEGAYVVSFKGSADSLLITVTGMNVGTHRRMVTNNSAVVNFEIDETPITLKEVAVKPPKITLSGDTLNYFVSRYTDQSDRVIADVLKKMPGIEVADNGKISFNGRAINKFYVEHLDLLQGRYGIATNNIAAKDVATVQILENHQPIKTLRKDSVFSDSPAINLRLKDSAKGTWSVNGLAGIGYKPLLWETELVGLYFGKNKQNISTYKGNNTGKNVFSEFTSHYDYERVNLSGNNMLSVTSAGSPPISEKRFVNNLSHAISSSQLIKINDSLQLTISALYFNDKTAKQGYSRREEFITGDSTLLIEERVTTATKTNNAELAIQLNSNASNSYFKNALNLKANWNEINGTGNTNSNAQSLNEYISQHLLQPSFSIDNTINWIKSIKKNTIKLYFSSGYGQQPNSLTVTPAGFIGDGSFSSLTQDVLSQNIASVLRISYGLRLGYFSFDYSLSENINLRSINSKLQGFASDATQLPIADSVKNDLWYNTFQTRLNQSYSYNNRKFKASINLPLTYYVLAINDQITDVSKNHLKWILLPSYSLAYDISGSWQLSTGAAYSKSYGSLGDAYTGYIMHNYRSLLRNTADKLFESKAFNSNFTIRYSNPFDAIFGNIGINYKLAWRNLLYGYNYQGIMMIKSTIENPTQADGYGANFYLQKGLDFWSSSVRLNGGYNVSRGELLIQEQRYNYRSQSYNSGTDINIYPHSKIGIQYGVSWRMSQNYTVGLANRFSPINGLSQNARINLFPTKEFTITMRGEHQYNSATSERNIAFADASITYKKKPFDIELEINNIFNTKQYVSASYSDVSTYYYSYQLRPFNVLIRTRIKLK
jgi:hypothetical protein